MVTPEGLLKVLDFGIAKLQGPRDRPATAAAREFQTEDGKILGTVGYMSPEQAAGKPRVARVGPVLPRHDPLRDAHRPARVEARHRGRDPRGDPSRTARADRKPQRRSDGASARPARALSRQIPRRALSGHARIGRDCGDPRRPGADRAHADPPARHLAAGARRRSRSAGVAIWRLRPRNTGPRTLAVLPFTSVPEARASTTSATA